MDWLSRVLATLIANHLTIVPAEVFVNFVFLCPFHLHVADERSGLGCFRWNSLHER